MPTNRQDEARYIEAFRNAFTNYPTGTTCLQDRPDCLVRTEGLTVGIEITRLHREVNRGERPLQETEELRIRAVQQALALYEKRGGPPLFVTVRFSRVPLAKRTITMTAAWLAERIEAVIPATGRTTEIVPTYAPGEEFPEEIVSVGINRPASLRHQEWWPESAGRSQSLTHTQVQAALARKAAHVAEYRAACDEIWLLLVLD